MNTLDQHRASHAWNAVSTFARVYIRVENGKKVRDPAAKKYGTHVRKLPSRIMASGLGQALAFLVAKGECPELLSALGDWTLDKRKNPESKEESPAPEALLRHIVNGTSDDLRFATAEALAYLQWLVRFAEAEGLTDSEGE
jgi:CRISPR-associated protein Cmr5